MEKKKPTLSIIVAASDNNIIGKDNALVWHLPADMQYFKETTMGHCVITGRKNYESISEKFRPLVGRTNIVVTRDKDFIAPGAIVVGSIEEAIEKAYELEKEEVFIIGGGEIYRQTLHMADKLYITRVYGDFDGDVFFPQINENEWIEVGAQFNQADEKNKYSTIRFVFERK